MTAELCLHRISLLNGRCVHFFLLEGLFVFLILVFVLGWMFVLVILPSAVETAEVSAGGTGQG